jgi:superfamily II DNA/RNA helicase
MPGATLHEEREERRNSIDERCEKAVELVNAHDSCSVCWCELNKEADTLVRMMPGSKQVSGSMSDDQKEEYLTAFSDGQIDCLIIKPKIGAWGLNWQHCNNVVSFPSHSYERHYQSVRRCYRFGQKKPVKVTLVVGEGEAGILANLRRKAAQSEVMFSSIVAHMKDAMHLQTSDYFPEKEMVPSWL